MSKVDYGLNGINVSMLLVLDDIVRPCRLSCSATTLLMCSTCTSNHFFHIDSTCISDHYFHVKSPKSIPLQRYIDTYTSHQSSKEPLHHYTHKTSTSIPRHLNAYINISTAPLRQYSYPENRSIRPLSYNG